MKELKGKFVIDNETKKECEVLDATENSALVSLKRNDNFYDRKVKCSICEKVSVIEKEEKFRCNTIVKIDGDDRNFSCRGKAVEIEKLYKGIDCLNWFEKSWFYRRFEVK